MRASRIGVVLAGAVALAGLSATSASAAGNDESPRPPSDTIVYPPDAPVEWCEYVPGVPIPPGEGVPAEPAKPGKPAKPAKPGTSFEFGKYQELGESGKVRKAEPGHQPPEDGLICVAPAEPYKALDKAQR